MPIIKNTNLDCGPVILCGDFNGESHEEVYQVIRVQGDHGGCDMKGMCTSVDHSYTCCKYKH